MYEDIPKNPLDKLKWNSKINQIMLKKLEKREED